MGGKAGKNEGRLCNLKSKYVIHITCLHWW